MGHRFWGQSYGDWEEITAPRRAPMPVNPAQQLDFRRFSSTEYLECYRLERDILRELSPDVPVTTNFMATLRTSTTGTGPTRSTSSPTTTT